MKAIDLVISLHLSGISAKDFMVVTLYKNQDPKLFLLDNFGDGQLKNKTEINPLVKTEINPLVSRDSQVFFALFSGCNKSLTTPDGASIFTPDYIYTPEEIGQDIYLFAID